MIAYHTSATAEERWRAAKGWKTAQVDDMDRIARCVKMFTWSPCLFQGGHRAERNFLASYWCAYDFDDGTTTLEEALRAFADLRHVIGLTKSHQKVKGSKPACDRFRVIVPWDVPIRDLRTYRYNMARQVATFDMDPACVDGARLFWPCTEIVSVNNQVIDNEVTFGREVYEPTDDFEAEKVAAEEERNHLLDEGLLPSWARRWLYNEVIPIGKRNNYIYGLAIDLRDAGFNEDTIVARIFASPTYKGQNVTPAVCKEIRDAVRSGMRSKKRDSNRTKRTTP